MLSAVVAGKIFDILAFNSAICDLSYMPHTQILSVSDIFCRSLLCLMIVPLHHPYPTHGKHGEAYMRLINASSEGGSGTMYIGSLEICIWSFLTHESVDR